METRLTPRACPSCHKLLDACTNLTGQSGPKPGDYGVCEGCGEVLEIMTDLGVRTVPMIEVPEPFASVLHTVRVAVLRTRAQRIASYN